ncbi:hypothetical protein SPF06_19640 [Sinomonas sp. JGH33]|uniref:Uncharacterized protein n=1 Tax=Sinomonas terricola TaxID=3110330 RepID=A0ABU5TBX5_9MICC|nr:hypothetical protein [Sinomonas sp. JGH33]MEA5456941.1 hypothetical protein [Sinomonas sp. JGH33]
MALKKRTSREREAAIEAFGNGAERLLLAQAVADEKARPVRPSVTPQMTDARDKLTARTMLLRFDDDMDLADLLAEVAQLEGRKKHPMALRALRIGLEQVKDTYE